MSRGSLAARLGALLVCLLWAPSASADTVDAWWLVTRIGRRDHSAFAAFMLVLAVLVVDYLINMVVIGLPAVMAGVQVRRVASDTVRLTLAAQLADRLGMILAGLAVLPFESEVTFASLNATFTHIAVASFVFSAAFVWILSAYFLVFRWSVSPRTGLIIATVAAVLTNPAWILAIKI